MYSSSILFYGFHVDATSLQQLSLINNYTTIKMLVNATGTHLQYLEFTVQFIYSLIQPSSRLRRWTYTANAVSICLTSRPEG